MAYNWTPEIIETICDRIISGESVRQICKEKGMPSEPTFYRKMMDEPEFESTIARAREVAQEPESEMLKDIADAATPETVHVAKLQIWTRMWIASKKAPKKYGDHRTTELTGPDGGAIKMESTRTDEEKAAFAAMLAKARAE